MNQIEKLLEEKDSLSRQEIFDRIEEITGTSDIEMSESIFYQRVRSNKFFLDKFINMKSEMIKQNPSKSIEIETMFAKTINSYKYTMNISAEMVKLILEIKPKKMKYIPKAERNNH